MIIESHSARMAALLAGLPSVSMIDYLERTGVFIPAKKRPKHRGARRKFTFRDVLVLKMIAVLLRNGASVAALKQALDGLQRLPWKAEEAVLEDRVGPLRHLVVSANRVYFARSKEELIDIAAGNQLSFSFIIDIEKLHTELAREWRQEQLEFSR